MREIKFRAFLRSDQRLPNGITLGYEKYPRGIYEVMDLNFASEIVTLWSEKEQTSFEVSFRKVKIMQYTGLKDKNDKKIYEGGIVCFNTLYNEHYIGEVRYFEDSASFFIIVKGHCRECLDDVYALEVLGNIYENKELLDE